VSVTSPSRSWLSLSDQSGQNWSELCQQRGGAIGPDVDSNSEYHCRCCVRSLASEYTKRVMERSEEGSRPRFHRPEASVPNAPCSFGFFVQPYPGQSSSFSNATHMSFQKRGVDMSFYPREQTSGGSRFTGALRQQRPLAAQLPVEATEWLFWRNQGSNRP
jgi:hypothetical protein